MVGVFIDLFYNYGIVGNIGYFIANNAELNNMYIDAVLYILYLNMSVKLRKGRRLYCFSYIINLYTQAFIIGSDAEGVCKELATIY